MKLAKRFATWLGIVLSLMSTADVLSAQEETTPDTTLKVSWKNGLRLDTGDGSVKIKIGGRIQNDWAWIDEEDTVTAAVGDQLDGTEFRRVRLYISGDIYENVFFKAQYDFAGGDADFKDVYLGLKGIPGIGHIKAGHYKEPFSLEELTSSKFLTFMERSLPNAFAPGRNTGLSIYNDGLNERLTWALGIFRDADNFGETEQEGKFAGSVRLTGLPWYAQEGRRLLHLGIAYSSRSPNDEMVDFDSRPEVHLADTYVDTMDIPSDGVDLLGGEVALVIGPFSFQGEYLQADVDSISANDPNFDGYYAYASFFLTGEHRKYKNSSGAFDRIKPKRNFLKDRGAGAWEVAVRYSGLDLTDQSIFGGELEDVTGAINWYLNPNTRLMFNYVLADLDGVGGTDSATLRFQVDF